MKFSVLETELGAILLFAREAHLWRLDLVASGPADARQRAAAEFPEAEEQPGRFEAATRYWSIHRFATTIPPAFVTNHR